MACVVVVLLATGVASGFYLKQERIDRAPEEWAFFYENRWLFEEVKDEFLIVGVAGSIDGRGYLVRDDGTGEWYPDLAEAAIRLFERAPDFSCRIRGNLMVGGMDVQFGFSSNRVPGTIIFTYSERDLTEFGRDEMGSNWYYSLFLPT
jgi:hypothetical protein